MNVKSWGESLKQELWELVEKRRKNEGKNEVKIRERKKKHNGQIV
jgi:hypothetical protein